ncbi:MAG: sigma-70 family RNA polymerase sigma factor [Planctomycetota bacterium]|nr:MAG: sigma-70 family RNA polymerase sigma factor [Planctomycetota bacterium]
MHEVSRILERLERGEMAASVELLPLVYEELRAMARSKLAQERPGHSWQATALVHEAWLRLVGPEGAERDWDTRGHFFAAAAESMRRILVESARRRGRLKRGGDRDRQEIDLSEIAVPQPRENLLDLDVALNKLAGVDSQAVALVQLRYFAGLTLAEAAQVLGISPRSADRLWAYAKAWLREELQSPDFQAEEN